MNLKLYDNEDYVVQEPDWTGLCRLDLETRILSYLQNLLKNYLYKRLAEMEVPEGATVRLRIRI